MSVRRGALLLLFVAALAAGGAWWWRGGHRTQVAAPRFRSITVQLRDITRTIVATGIVAPRNRVTVVPPIAGRVDALLVDEGDVVAAGQTVAVMSSTERAALLDAARTKGPVELARWEALYKQTSLLAPVAGRIIARNVDVGQVVTTQDELFALADRLIVTAQVDETDLALVRVGQGAVIRLDAYPALDVAAEVRQIAYEAKTVNNVTVYEIEVAPRTVPASMRSGMTADVDFIVDRAVGVPALPVTAVTHREGTTTVLLRDGDAAPRPATIATGLTDGRFVAVPSLPAGTRVWLRENDRSEDDDNAADHNPFLPFSRPRR